MYKEFSYNQWSDYYARKCNVCNGDKMTIIKGIPLLCDCQKYATAKYRLEKIEITPDKLKYTSWEDFTGLIKKNGEIEGALTVSSATLGRDKAFNYCFKTNYDSSISKNVNNIKVQDNLLHGINLVITGPQNSGKTLLAALILKEVNRSVLIGCDLEYSWVRFFDIIQSASWSSEKDIEYIKLERYAELNFLFIDGVDIHKGGHNSPPDHVAMNVLFSTRKSHNLPTIFVCSNSFAKTLKTNPDIVSSYFGEEFLKAVSHPSNIFIGLKKSND